MNKKSSTFFEKHTKCCTLSIFSHNIYSRKDVLYRRLQKKEGLLNLDVFFKFLSKKSGKEKVVAVTVAVAKETKWVAACVRCYKQRRCYFRYWFVLYDIVFFPETFTKTGNFSEGYKGCIKKIIDYSGTSVSALTSYQGVCCNFRVFSDVSHGGLQ